MHASILVALLAALLVFDSALARPAKPATDHGAQGKHNAAAEDTLHGLAVADLPNAQVAAVSEPLPRRLARAEGTLPVGRRPSGLGDISRIPKQRAMQIAEKRSPAPPLNSKRHDHINSPSSTTSGACNVGEAQCCQSIHQSGDKSAQTVSSLLGLALPADNSMLGVQCTPLANLLSVTGSNTCHSQPICCTGNEYHGLVSMGCSPLSL